MPSPFDVLSNMTTAKTVLSSAINSILLSPETDKCDPDQIAEFNCSVEEFLLHEMGKNEANLWISIPVSILYVVILVAGMAGNLGIVIVTIRNRLMQTSINYYLFNLAVADLLYLSFGLPFEIHMFWHQYPWLFGLAFCKLRSFISEACSIASVLTIVAFTVERYVAICWPLHTFFVTNLRRVVCVLTLIWLISFISAFPVAYYRFIYYIRYPPDGQVIPDSGICTVHIHSHGLYEALTIAFFIIPLLILIVMYSCIAIQLNAREKQHMNGRFGKNSVAVETKQLKSRRKIVRMLIVIILHEKRGFEFMFFLFFQMIVMVFFISWAPFHIQRLVYIYGKHWSKYIEINETLFMIAGFFYYLSCAINPIIYNAMSKRYRTAFRQTFWLKKK